MRPAVVRLVVAFVLLVGLLGHGFGLLGLVVASYGDRTLVVPKAQAQRVRDVVRELEATDRF